MSGLIAHDPVREQLQRIAYAGFVPNRGQRSAAGQAEYRRALRDLPLDLLRLAVDRLIAAREDHFYPVPAAIRAYIRDELHAIEAQRFDEMRRHVLADLRARGMPVLGD